MKKQAHLPNARFGRIGSAAFITTLNGDSQFSRTQVTTFLSVVDQYSNTLITAAHQVHHMPVSIDDFETGELPRGPSVPEQVLAYLYRHRDQAFTRSEIATGVDEDPNTVGTALSRLKDRELVRHKGAYWAITDDLERVTAAYDLHTATARLDDEDGGIDADEWDAAAPDVPHPSERDG